MGAPKTIRTSCTRDCPDACGIVATVEDGRITRIAGDPDHPVTQGFLCYRTNRFLARQYDAARLTAPLLRRDGRLVAVGWDEALDRVAQTMLRIREESGAAAILQYKSGGSMGISKHLTEAFFERFGPVTVKSGDICSGAGEAAQETDFGTVDSHDIFDIRHSRTIVLWGKNPYVSNVHLLPLLKAARDRGANIVQIDPVHHRGAELARLYLQPRPGGDDAIVLGALHLLFARDRIDAAAADYCDHLPELQALALSRPVEAWAHDADVGVDAIERFVELYAEGPSAILVGWGMQRRANGSAAVRWLDALGAVSGNLGVPGGGVSFCYPRRGAFDLSFHRGRPGAARAIPEPLLGPGILAASDPPIRMVWVHCGNPVAMLPASNTVAEALRTRELTVVVDSFLTDTAANAHVVLPTTTMLEDEDLVGAFGTHWLGNVRRVVAPPEGVKTDYEIVQALARRVGLADAFTDSIRDWKRRLLGRVAPHGITLETLEAGAARNPFAGEVLFADRRFQTPSGRVNLVHRRGPQPPQPTDERPLLLAALATREAQSSQWSTPMPDPPVLTVHPASAAGFAEGTLVRVESATGALVARLRFDPRQRRDMALMAKGGWLGRGACANALIEARETDAGSGAVYYDTPVRLVGLP